MAVRRTRPLPKLQSSFLSNDYAEPPQQLYAWLPLEDVRNAYGLGGNSSVALEAVDAAWIAGDRNFSIADVMGAPVSVVHVEDAASKAILAAFVAVNQPNNLDGAWVALAQQANGPVRALYQGNVDGERIPEIFFSKPRSVDAETVARLASLDVIAKRPDVSDYRLNGSLRLKGDEAIGLAVYDVGQGSCGALVDESCRPMMYFDVGGGNGQNSASYPKPMRFCVARQPPILLSHWDADHWVSLKHDPRLLQLTWIAPRQTLRPAQAMVAAHILFYGRLYIWGRGRRSFSNAQLTIDLATGSARSNNNSGLGAVVHISRGDVLLPGDADYRYLPTRSNLAGLVVTHHGAKFLKTTRIPTPLNPAAPAIYSYGAGNWYKHPRTIQRHRSAGWIFQFETAKRRSTSALGHCILGLAGVRNNTGCLAGSCNLGSLTRV